MMNRRKEDRYRIQGLVFAIDAHEPRRIGEVVDISRSGIAFRYMNRPGGYEPTTRLNIFSHTHNLFLDNVNFDCVSDCRIKAHPNSSIPMRKHCGQFTGLTEKQQATLDDFINTHFHSPQKSP